MSLLNGAFYAVVKYVVGEQNAFNQTFKEPDGAAAGEPVRYFKVPQHFQCKVALKLTKDSSVQPFRKPPNRQLQSQQPLACTIKHPQAISSPAISMTCVLGHD